MFCTRSWGGGGGGGGGGVFNPNLEIDQSLNTQLTNDTSLLADNSDLGSDKRSS